MNRLIRAVLRATWPVHRPIDGIANRFVGRGSLLVLVAHLYGEGDGWTRPQIREQLARLRTRCALLSLSEARRRLRERTLPSRAAVLFVDDGADTFYEAGYPILRELEIPFVLSIIPGLIPADDRTHFLARLMRAAGLEYERSPQQINDVYRRVTGADGSISDHASLFDAAQNVSVDRIRHLIDALEIPDDRFMTWDQIKQMLAESRAELANHSMSHPLMRRVRGDWMEFEIAPIQVADRGTNRAFGARFRLPRRRRRRRDTGCGRVSRA